MKLLQGMYATESFQAIRHVNIDMDIGIIVDNRCLSYNCSEVPIQSHTQNI
jgi:hypothetical protein